MPEPVRRKLRYFIERGAVRVLDGDGVEQAATDSHAANQNDAGLHSEASAESPDAGATSAASDGTEFTTTAQERSDPLDVEKIFAVARNVAVLGTALGSPLRAAILVVLASDRALGPSELARLLGKPRQTISWHALFLERAGFLISERESGVRRYRINARATERVARLLGR